MKFQPALRNKLIYVFRIPDEAHRGCLKVGEATADTVDLQELIRPNSKALNEAARKRIDSYTGTAGIPYDLLHTEATFYSTGKGMGCISDHDVHEVLLRSGIERKTFDTAHRANEWFRTDLETVKRAIKAAKEGRSSLLPAEVTQQQTPIAFRPEQQQAIDKTVRHFSRKNGRQMLWNAKMRFGKTLSALQVVKELKLRRTLILTHRPVVDAGWYDDFRKIFYDTPGYLYGSRNVGEPLPALERHLRKNNDAGYVYFASMQDLRGSELVGGSFDKNNDVFSTPWDLIIIDEAHEGTKTSLGESVIRELQKPKPAESSKGSASLSSQPSALSSPTRVLRLSGTPFNLFDDFREDEIYTWDYVMEQRAKAEWDRLHPGDPNPYATLPALNIFTYDLGKTYTRYADATVAFNFREFFRTNADGRFVHEADVRSFLDLLARKDDNSAYPFANDHYRNIFRHTLWMIPGVREARALSSLLQQHPVFGHFRIVNVAGDGDSDEENGEALQMVQKAIGPDPDATRTITLSCGRLTTGVSVPAWTGVLMLSGSYHTAASAYMQTIFRVQTPAVINGRVKEQAYVFDFAPDRTLQVLATVPRLCARAGRANTEAQKREMGEFLNFCPVIAVEGSRMERLNVGRMLEQLKRAYVERVVRNGFEDGALYNDELLKLNDVDLREFDSLRKIIGQTKAMGTTGQIDVNSQGLTDEQYEEKKKLEKKKRERKELTAEEQARLEEFKARAKVRETAISILRGISIRMPLMIYGADVKDEDTELTIDNFTSLIDARSWEEFMPRGVTKQHFNRFRRYYDPDIFTASAKRIRAMARAADRLPVEERIQRLAAIFATFRNPDKETVLTPWRVVNMHLGDTLGGWNFYNADYTEELQEPRYIDHEAVTADVFTPRSHLLEINSKSGLYPLYLTYSIYRARVAEAMVPPDSVEAQQALWDRTVADNIYVVCKTPMAKAITRRTLLGFRPGRTNMYAPDDLINKVKNQPDLFIRKVRELTHNVKINAIVGNPPYQEMDGGGTGSSAQAIYNKFWNMGMALGPDYLTMIMPSRWMSGGKGLESFREEMMNNRNIRLLHDFLNARECFSNVAIEGGVCYIRWDKNSEGKCKFVSHSNGKIRTSYRYLNDGNGDVVVRETDSLSIIDKSKSKNSFASLVSTRNLFKVSESNLKDTRKDEAIKVFGRFDGVREIKYLEFYNSKDSRATAFLGKWKVFMSKADGAAGQLGSPIPARIIGKAEIGDPDTICTETFLALGPLNSETEARNVVKYLETRFCRFLIGVRKLKNMTQDTYSFVPLQDFTEGSDIDWSKPVEDVDRQLYRKYGLDAEEVEFIEKMIKPM